MIIDEYNELLYVKNNADKCGIIESISVLLQFLIIINLIIFLNKFLIAIINQKKKKEKKKI